MRLGVVVQRYGADINGGAELHARYIAGRLARHAEVEVLTTCARDYVTWRNELTPGTDTLDGLIVRRFPVRRERDPDDFGRRSNFVFEHRHSVADELRWLESEGPTSPALIDTIAREASRFDFFIFFSFRYYHAYHGIRSVPSRAILVPTAERDPAVGLSLFGPVFRGVRAIMYNSPEERAMINAVSDNGHVPGVVVGVGSQLPARTDAARFRAKFGLRDPFILYIGRIDENKGCAELFRHFARYARSHPKGVSLVLMGRSVLPVPDSPRIHHLGFVEDQDKFDGLAAAEALVMPSFYESLSMVVLEAWALGRPVLANGRCDVLRGQCVRSNAGLYYETYEEFAETLNLLQRHRSLRSALGANGRIYYERHYSWSVIDRSYLEMIERLDRENREGPPRPPLEPLPGLFARRRRVIPPSAGIVDALPHGPVVATPAPAAEVPA